MSSDGAFERGMAALEVGQWDDARQELAATLVEQEAVEVLLGLADALWWLGDAAGSVERMERAYVLLRERGDRSEAATTAIWLSVIYKKTLGNQSACSGWISRATSLVGDTSHGPLQGWLLWARAEAATDPHSAVELSRRALEQARGSAVGDDGTTRDASLEMCALSALGEGLVAVGHVAEGLALVDEAMVGVLGGECDNRDAVVAVTCSMLGACDRAADLARIEEWCRVADRFMKTYGCPFLYADCRTRYGSVLLARGHWDDAERELSAAIRVAPAGTDYHAQASCRLALLRLRQGRFEEATALLQPLEGRPCAQPVLAALRHARGEHAVAAVVLERWLDTSSPGGLEVAAAVDLLVAVYLATGDVGQAARATRRLEDLARVPANHREAAHATFVAARLAAARGDTDRAEELLVQAMDLFSGCNLPYETALARRTLAATLADHQPVVAVAEAEGAYATLERLGSGPEADAAAALVRSLGGSARTGPKDLGVLTKREQEVLRLVAEGLSNPEIAQRLYISRKTASHHVSNMLTKLGVRNRAEAAAYATRASVGQG